MQKYIAVLGNVGTGFSFHGPFDTDDDAIEWADQATRKEGLDWSVSLLNEPED